MSSRKTTIAVVAGATVVVGATAFFLARRKSVDDGVINDDDDDAFSAPNPSILKASKNTPSKQPTTKAPQAAASKTAAEVPVTKAAEGMCPASTASVEHLLADALRDMGMADSTPVETPKAVSATAKPSESAVREFPALGLSMTMPEGWEIREDLSPFPNVAMLTVWNQELGAEDPQLQQLGMVPMIILSVEDVRGDNVNLTEFKERCKELAMNQMFMMSGGAVQPKTTKDNGINTGPFRHVLEYVQSLPPFYEIMVLNLLEVRHSVAYSFQMMCAPSVLQKHRNMFMDIARSMRIADIVTEMGHVELHTGTVRVSIDTTWSWEYGEKCDALAIFTTSSPIKKEEIRLYAENNVPKTTHKPRDERKVDGVTIVSSLDGSQEKKTFTYNGYTLVVKPLLKAVSSLSDESLVAVIKSVAPSTETPKPKNGGTFVNPEHGYQVDVTSGGRLVASRIGGGSVMYAPHGVKMEISDDEHPPTVTIRVGSSETDPDCMDTLDEWEARMRQEAKEGEIKDIQRKTINGEPCLYFVSNTMEEVAPGRRIELRGKVFVFVRNHKTTLIRWEMETGMWRRLEREMNAFLESFRFL